MQGVPASAFSEGGQRAKLVDPPKRGTTINDDQRQSRENSEGIQMSVFSDSAHSSSSTTENEQLTTGQSGVKGLDVNSLNSQYHRNTNAPQWSGYGNDPDVVIGRSALSQERCPSDGSLRNQVVSLEATVRDLQRQMEGMRQDLLDLQHQHGKPHQMNMGMSGSFAQYDAVKQQAYQYSLYGSTDHFHSQNTIRRVPSERFSDYMYNSNATPAHQSLADEEGGYPMDNGYGMRSQKLQSPPYGSFNTAKSSVKLEVPGQLSYTTLGRLQQPSAPASGQSTLFSNNHLVGTNSDQTSSFGVSAQSTVADGGKPILHSSDAAPATPKRIPTQGTSRQVFAEMIEADTTISEETKVKIQALFASEDDEARKIIVHLHGSVDSEGYCRDNHGSSPFNLDVHLTNAARASGRSITEFILAQLEFLLRRTSCVSKLSASIKAPEGCYNEYISEIKVNPKAKMLEIVWRETHGSDCAKDFMKNLQDVLRSAANESGAAVAWVKSVAISKPPELRELRRRSQAIKQEYESITRVETQRNGMGGFLPKELTERLDSGQVRAKMTKLYAEVPIIGDPNTVFKSWVNFYRFKTALHRIRCEHDKMETKDPCATCHQKHIVVITDSSQGQLFTLDDVRAAIKLRINLVDYQKQYLPYH